MLYRNRPINGKPGNEYRQAISPDIVSGRCPQKGLFL